MAEKRVVWTSRATKQLRSILKYWLENNQSDTYSQKLSDRIDINTQGILRNPKRCPETIFKNTRVSSLGNYSIFYKIESNGIIITAFWDNRQDPEKLRDFLKKNAGAAK